MKRSLLLLTLSVFIVVAVFIYTRTQGMPQGADQISVQSPPTQKQLATTAEKAPEPPAAISKSPTQSAKQARITRDEPMVPEVPNTPESPSSTATRQPRPLNDVLTIDQHRHLVKLGHMKDWDGFFRYLDAHGLDINDPITADGRGRVYEYLLSNLHSNFERNIAERLIDMGIDLNPPRRNKIKRMLETGDVDEIRFVMDHYPETLNTSWYKAITHAVMRQDSERINYLKNEIADITPAPIPEKELEYLERICDRPELFEFLKEMGYTFGTEAAKHAIQGQSRNVLEYHVNNGVDLRDISVDGNNAMDLAFQNPHPRLPMIQYLESQGFSLAPRHLNVVNMYISDMENYLSNKPEGDTIDGVESFYLPNMKKMRDYIMPRLE